MSVKTFNQTNGLWMVDCGVVKFDTENLALFDQSCEVNWAPLSDVMSTGKPKRANQ